jgi:hypothetical protein
MLLSYDEHWLVENRVRLAVFTGSLSREDMMAADNRVLSALEASDHKIHLVLDVRHLQSSPSLNDCLRMRHIFHTNVGWYLTIGATKNAVARMFVSMLMALARVKYKDTRSLEEAYLFLRTVDPTLPEAISYSL